MCTQTFLLSVQEMLRNNNAELNRMRQAIVYEGDYVRLAIQRFETDEMYRQQLLHQENRFDNLELRLNQLCTTINRQLAEVSAAQFGINYQTSHPDAEFVIFIREDGNIVQRTNRYSPS
jgi:hypothetical protein